MALVLAFGPAWAETGQGPDLRPDLRRGIALSHWLQYGGGTPVGTEDIRLIEQAGFDHVRLSFDPHHLGWLPHSAPEIFPAGGLHRALELILSSGNLAVLVDLHLRADTKQWIEDSAEGEAAVIALWSGLAQDLASLPPGRVAFELFNEPQYYGKEKRWAALQKRLVQAVRAKAPDHLIVATFPQGAGLEGMEGALPVDDPNMAYAFHFYLPYHISHFGAPWWGGKPESVRYLADISYPPQWSDLKAVTVRPGGDRARAAAELAATIAAGWGPEAFARNFAKARAWGDQHGVRVLCTEFGAILQDDAKRRHGWIKDVRIALEDQGIGWTMWNYAADFAIAEGALNRRRLNPDTAAALGLTQP